MLLLNGQYTMQDQWSGLVYDDIKSPPILWPGGVNQSAGCHRSKVYLSLIKPLDAVLHKFTAHFV